MSIESLFASVLGTDASCFSFSRFMRPRGGYRSLSWSVCDAQELVVTSQLTLKVKENIGLIVFEHLGDKLNVHIVNVDFLFDVLDRSSSVFSFLQMQHTCRLLFNIMTASLSFSWAM